MRTRTHDTITGLYEELYRLQDMVECIDVNAPDADGIIAHLEDLITHTLEELELAGEYVG